MFLRVRLTLLLHFNSIKVRLEQNKKQSEHKQHHYFNSIKVRLEQIQAMIIDIATIFQFHKGAIRTLSFLPLPITIAISIP